MDEDTNQDAPIRRAEADRLRLEKLERSLTEKLRDISARKAELETFISVSRKYMGGGAIADPGAATTTVNKGITPGTTGARMEAVAVKTLRLAGGPLGIGDLLNKVQSAGVEIRGQRPATNLSSVLSRSDKVVYQHGVGWTLRDRDAKPTD